MTMSVYRLSPDGTRHPVSPQVVVGDPQGPGMPIEPARSSAYPPCACRRCKGRARTPVPVLPVRSGWCHWHGGPSGTARIIHLIERASGPPYPQTACAPCREQRGLIALTDTTPREALWNV
ncbi:hypothetical protein ACWF94_00770 [Streptomyces sp. NPDC055078]